jgi:hypothetical protein
MVSLQVHSPVTRASGACVALLDARGIILTIKVGGKFILSIGGTNFYLPLSKIA